MSRYESGGSNAGLLAATAVATALFGIIVGYINPDAEKVRRMIAEAQQKIVAPAASGTR